MIYELSGKQCVRKAVNMCNVYKWEERSSIDILLNRGRNETNETN